MNLNIVSSFFVAWISLAFADPAIGCTGITLRGKDGSVIFARTLEWGTFDLDSRLVVSPRTHGFTSPLGDGKVGLTWKGRHGFVGVDVLKKDYVLDGLNENGLSVNLFYHPGYADHPEVNPANLEKSIGPLDVPQYLLSTCANIAEVREAMSNVTVVAVLEPSIGIPAPTHLIVTDPSGEAVVIEYLNKQMQIQDAPLGVITNAPSYDWHTTNLRNYLNLSPVALPAKHLAEMDFAPLGGGSGLIGLPGDFTPPSRFVRAVAFSKTARPTDTGAETMYEAFRILDNFNVPLGASEGGGTDATAGMRSSTLWTTAYDTRNLVMQYHTMHNRRVRQVELKGIDFANLEDVVRQPLDEEKAQDIKDVTLRR